jgi:hypothetical protein
MAALKHHSWRLQQVCACWELPCPLLLLQDGEEPNGALNVTCHHQQLLQALVKVTPD